MNGIKPPGVPVITGNSYGGKKTSGKVQQSGASFQEILNRRFSEEDNKPITFSKHALSRTEERGISISQSDMNRLDGAVGKAKDKGLTDTLVLMDNTAFIVNVPNKVVVTVVDGRESENNVFTNIDGAVIV